MSMYAKAELKMARIRADGVLSGKRPDEIAADIDDATPAGLSEAAVWGKVKDGFFRHYGLPLAKVVDQDQHELF